MTCDATCSDVTVTRPRDRDAPQCRVRGLEFGSPFPCLGRNYIYDKPKLTDNPAVRAVWGLGGALGLVVPSGPWRVDTSVHVSDQSPRGGHTTRTRARREPHPSFMAPAGGNSEHAAHDHELR